MANSSPKKNFECGLSIVWQKKLSMLMEIHSGSTVCRIASRSLQRRPSRDHAQDHGETPLKRDHGQAHILFLVVSVLRVAKFLKGARETFMFVEHPKS